MADHTSFGLAQIGQISMAAHDLERAVTFYRDKLGMRHLFSAPNLAFFDCDGVRLMLSLPEREQTQHASSIIYFKVDAIEQAYQTLGERGVHFDDAPHVIANMGSYDLWMAFFRDSENNVLSIMSEVPHAS